MEITVSKALENSDIIFKNEYFKIKRKKLYMTDKLANILRNKDLNEPIRCYSFWTDIVISVSNNDMKDDINICIKNVNWHAKYNIKYNWLVCGNGSKYSFNLHRKELSEDLKVYLNKQILELYYSSILGRKEKLNELLNNK